MKDVGRRGSDEQTLDFIMVGFSGVGWLHIACLMRHVGIEEFFLCRHSPEVLLRHHG